VQLLHEHSGAPPCSLLLSPLLLLPLDVVFCCRACDEDHVAIVGLPTAKAQPHQVAAVL
jgi:hypothetical protein